MKNKWLGIILIGLAWPLLHYGIGLLRFGVGNAPTSLWQALLDFGLFGLVAGWIYVFFQGRAANPRQRNLMMLGYLAASPFAFVGSLAGGLFLPGVIGAIVMGGLPLLIGAGLGHLIGGMANAG